MPNSIQTIADWKHSGKYFQISYVAQKVGRHIRTLQSYEHLGIVPATGFRTPTGGRLYSLQQLKVLMEGCRKMDTGELLSREQLRRWIEPRWAQNN